ncbi:hypothetical protein SE116_11505 [Staphylococcus aureus]|uniref:hypothetical protein n=1 Tax=Staphylococcus aureus TaxID=1280 RepID=UPI0029C0A7D4|nr:hypothetical protein [Staphylococcus aureus]WPF98895.1 hypothetical protein SE116_11505 [Staphylococcus aureus]
MQIDFNENGDFYFLGREILTYDDGFYVYRLASKDLGNEITVLSSQNLDLKFLDKVILSDLKLNDCSFKGQIHLAEK